MDRPGSELVGAFVAAYRPVVRARMDAGSIAAPDGLEEALDNGELWLEGELVTLLELPYGAQPRSPLEVFQAAMRFPSEVLSDAGVPPVARDKGQESALPGDRYDLAPASSQDMGEEAWRAHLAWGAAKAQALRPARRPVALYVGNQLMDRSRIEQATAAAGLELVVVRGADDWGDDHKPVAALVDLTHPSADELIPALAATGARVVAFGPHVDDLAMVRARSLGAEAVARSRFFGDVGAYLPRLV